MPPQTDVIIIGAGLTGLTAAHALQRAGLTCTILEARDRVGGKTYTLDPLHSNKPIDLGAAWINDTTQSEVYALAKELSLDLVVQNTTGNVIQEDINGDLSTFEYGGAPAHLSEPDGLSEMLRIRQLFEDTCQTIDIYDVAANDTHLDTMTLQQWVTSHSKSLTALASASVWTRAMLGLEPSEVSALYFLNYCKSGGGLLQMRKDTKDGGQYLRFARGTQSLSRGLAARLRPGTVHLSSPVCSITQSDPDDPKNNTITVTVTTSTSTSPPQIQTHTYTARTLILTLPNPLHKTLTFSPPLPHPKIQLSSTTIQGYTNKIHLHYHTPFWRRAHLTGLLQSFTGPITVTRDSSVDELSQYSLTCFLVGAVGRELSMLPQAGRFERVVGHVRRVFTPFCTAANVTVPNPIAVTEYEWSNDPFSMGCPVPVMPPELMSKYEKELRTPFGGCVFCGDGDGLRVEGIYGWGCTEWEKGCGGGY